MYSKKKKTDTEDESIYSEYFKYTQQYTQTHGKKTIVLMQVGSFYEIYGLKYPNTDRIVESLITDISELTGLTVIEKSNMYNQAALYMAGFRDYTLEKYVQILIENGYIVVEIIQLPDPIDTPKNKKKIRAVNCVYSAGTHISYEIDTKPQLSNHIMSVWIETIINRSLTTKKDRLIYGISVLNIYTGESSMFEHETEYILNPTSFDELERYISIYSPSEIIFMTSLDSFKMNSLFQYIGITNQTVHTIFLKDTENETNKTALNCTKQNYIQYILSSFFGDDVYPSCSEFSYYIYATQSFCYLLHFIQEHNIHFLKNIRMPIFQNVSDRVVLANHTLKQLNIISDQSEEGKKKGNLSSVLSFLNKCCTAMGKRLFKTQITSPVFNEEWLTIEYSMISIMLESNQCEMIDHLRKYMSSIKDMDKISRQWLYRKIYPSSIFQLFQSILTIQQIHQCMYEVPLELMAYLCSDSLEKNIFIQKEIYDIFDQKLRDVMDFMDSRFIISACNSCHSLSSFTNPIIQKNISKELDEYVYKYDVCFAQMNTILHFLISCIQQHQSQQDHKKKNREDTIGENNDTEYIKLNETDKHGYSLQITKTRGEMLMHILKSKMNISPEIELPNNVRFFLKDVKVVSSNKTNHEIEIPFLNEICREMISLKSAIQKKTTEVFFKILEEFEGPYMNIVESISKYIAKIDVLFCKSFLAKTYHYCRPEIEKSSLLSFVDATDLRHVLIEHLQQQEIYVPNDICLGKESTRGILLYGTNAVGKTSLIRALGISIIMAQAGMYVPCSKFIYKPYTAMYSRILGNDNLFKGLSTFAVEMSELRVILKHADANSFILGDELCSGTETESALSIFITSLIELHKRCSSFMFATHFHEIVHFSEIQEMEYLKLKHLEVFYDREKDCLIYDRKLKDGPGSRTYGLEVCKSLYLPEDFMEHAFSIRNKYFPEKESNLNHSSSRYNSLKIRGKCEVCHSEMGQEIHHLQEQKEADETGYINGYFHKNHPANLMSICEKCHDKIHFSNDDVLSQKSIFTHYSGSESSSKKKVIRKKSTKGYIFSSESR